MARTVPGDTRWAHAHEQAEAERVRVPEMSGTGGFGQVRKARDLKINLLRAVKVLTGERFRECDASETTCGIGCPFHVESQYGRRP